jgi:signal transduction histidine kinase
MLKKSAVGKANFLYVPHFLKKELDDSETQQLSISTGHDLAKRSRTGGLFVFGCLLLGTFISDLPEQNPFIHAIILVTALMAGILRIWVAKKVPIEKQSFIHWQWTYSVVVLSSAVTWFAFFLMHLSIHAFDESTLILLIATAGYLGTLTSTMFMWKLVTFTYIGIVILPIFFSLLLVEINTSFILLIGFAIYLFFLSLQVIGLNKQYWQSAKTHILLERQTEALREAKEEAENAVQIKTQFLSSMSHELRTPMNAVIGFSHLLETDDKNPLNTEQKESVSVIKASAEHLLNLINDILDLVKVDSDQIKLDLKPIYVDEVVSEVISIHKPKAETKHITINLSLKEPEEFRIIADELRLKQVLINLLSNAIKYNFNNGFVDVEVAKEDANIIVRVRDSGKGISKDKFEYVFEPFNRLGMEKTSIPGTGIGLAICKDLVDKMNGEIGFDSNPESGMVFWLKFKAL